MLPPALFAVAFATWITMLALAWPGYYGMNHATGTVAALADAVLRGQGPGHDDGETFLATIYFPPFPLAVAGVRRLGLGWRDALRLLSLLSALTLLAATLAAVRALGGGWGAAALAAALLLAAAPFKAASLAGRADLLAAGLGVAAFAAWLRDPELRGWTAPALAAAAWLTKATAIALPLAVAAWAWQGARRAEPGRFLARFALVLAAGALLTGPWHGLPWYGDAVRTLWIAPPNSTNVLRGPAELLRYLGTWSELAAMAALAAAMLWSGEWRGQPVGAFFAATLLMTWLAMANRGSDHNHLAEPCAVASACAGVWAERRLARGALLVAALLAVVVAGASWRDLASAWSHARQPEERRERVLAALARERAPIAFAEDPLIALEAGKRPALSDPATLRSLERRHDARAERLLDRVARGQYDPVVLNENLAAQAGWYRDWHLGPGLAGAVETRYHAAGAVDGYFLYRPREGSIPAR